MAYSKVYDSKLEMCDYLQNSRNKGVAAVLGERRFPLNNSRSKFISVSINSEYGYEPCIQLMGNKGDVIMFRERDWLDFLDYQGVITNYLYANDDTSTIFCENFTLSFEQILSCRVIKISRNKLYVYLGYETICKLWELLPVIKYRIEMCKKLQFTNYFNVLKKGLEYQPGNIFVNASKILNTRDSCPTENVCLVLELMYVYPEVFEKECSTNI